MSMSDCQVYRNKSLKQPVEMQVQPQWVSKMNLPSICERQKRKSPWVSKLSNIPKRKLKMMAEQLMSLGCNPS